MFLLPAAGIKLEALSLLLPGLSGGLLALLFSSIIWEDTIGRSFLAM